MNQKFDADKQNKLALRFHQLHHNNGMLILPNVWDSASAKIFEKNGFPALATTSSGVSWACGYQDGEHIPPEVMIESIRKVTRVVGVPVTADIESGYYGTHTKQLSDFIIKVIEAGAVGVNLEDADPHSRTMVSVEQHVALIKLVKQTAQQKGVSLFINARTDAFERADGDVDNRIKVCIERAQFYEDAGADGIFIPFVVGMEAVARLKEGVNLPLNVLMNDSLNVPGLKKLKVNRVSVGGKPMIATLHTLQQIASELKGKDSWPSLFVKNPNYPEVNGWFS